MKLTRKIRLAAALIVLSGVLFTQFAASAYACPLHSSDNVAVLAASGVARVSMPDCGQPDMKQSALCRNHCQQDKQIVDKAEVPTIASPLAVGFVSMLVAVPTIKRLFIASQSSHLQRATAPPLSIRNCCFRI